MAGMAARRAAPWSFATARATMSQAAIRPLATSGATRPERGVRHMSEFVGVASTPGGVGGLSRDAGAVLFSLHEKPSPATSAQPSPTDVLAAVQNLTVLPWLSPGLFEHDDVEPLQAVGRNSRPPKKANKGARPNSHVMRRKKRIK